MRYAHAAAVLTWIYTAGFGGPATPIAIYLSRRGVLPWFMDAFPMYGGPWSSRYSIDILIVLLATFLFVCLLSASAAWLVWRGSRTGAIISLALLPVEAVFWVGFALPIPWLFGFARAALLAAGWRALNRRAATRPPHRRPSRSAR